MYICTTDDHKNKKNISLLYNFSYIYIYIFHIRRNIPHTKVLLYVMTYVCICDVKFQLLEHKKYIEDKTNGSLIICLVSVDL
jgi:hypothetical protein